MATQVLKGPPGVAAGLFKASDGKGSHAQALRPGQASTLAAGDPLSRMQGVSQYGKGHSYLPPGSGLMGPAAMDPTVHPGSPQIRDPNGGVRRNPRSGGLGDTKESMPTSMMSD
jgi:hypothetical protein